MKRRVLGCSPIRGTKAISFVPASSLWDRIEQGRVTSLAEARLRKSPCV